MDLYDFALHKDRDNTTLRIAYQEFTTTDCDGSQPGEPFFTVG